MSGPIGPLAVLNQWIMFCLSVSMAVLSLLIYLKSKDIYPLLVIISGLLTASTCFAGIIIKLLKKSCFIISGLCLFVYLFQLVSSILYLNQVLDNKYMPYRFRSVIPILFVLNQTFVGIEIALSFSAQEKIQPKIDVENGLPSEIDNLNTEDSTNLTYLAEPLHHPYRTDITKKESAKTLVEHPIQEKDFLYQLPNQQINYVAINTSQQSRMSSYSLFEYDLVHSSLGDAHTNWMNGSIDTNIQPLKLTPQPSNNNNNKHSPTHSRKTSSISRKRSLRAMTSKFHYRKHSLDTRASHVSKPTPMSHNRYRSLNIELRGEYNTPKSPLTKKGSSSTIASSTLPPPGLIQGRVPSIINDITPIIQKTRHYSVASITSSDLNKEKSTASLTESQKENKMKRRQQRWQSINDEKQFLSNLSNSLLPPVLQSGESHILQLQRKMNGDQTTEEKEVDDKYTTKRRSVTFKNTPKVFQISPESKYSYSPERLASPVKLSSSWSSNHEDWDKSSIQKSPNKSNRASLEELYEINDTIRFDEYEDDLNDPNIISEFSKFTQDTLVIEEDDVINDVATRRSSRSIRDDTSRIDENDYERTINTISISMSDGEELGNKPEDGQLEGLEVIPHSSEVSLWPYHETSMRDKVLRHITLQEWEHHSGTWEGNKQRVGSGLSIPHLDLIVPDEQITYATELNIDDVSDSTRPSFTLSDRSFSAPSLHTYRNVTPVSTESMSPIKEVMTPVKEVKTPQTPEATNMFKTPNNSPSKSKSIKKFLQESPRKVYSKLTANLMSPDVAQSPSGIFTKSHAHNESVASHQYSINSFGSSRSGSPKKSSFSGFKRKRSETFTLQLATPKPKESNLFNAMMETQDPSPDSIGSENSSCPSVVLGEYDREKWRTIKTLMEKEANKEGDTKMV